MTTRIRSKLDPKKKYLQIALNSTLSEAKKIITALPKSDRIIVEAGTPFIKRYGVRGIRLIRNLYAAHLFPSGGVSDPNPLTTGGLLQLLVTGAMPKKPLGKQPSVIFPYIVADLKATDRGATEVQIAAEGGASAAIALGNAPIETLNSFVSACEATGLDAMIDMMNVEYPLSVLRALKKVPPVVILHRGVDEERDNKEKQLPLHEIRRIKGNYDVMIAIAGGDTLREVQSAIFNDADIVVVWKSVYQKTTETIDIVNGFLKQIK